MKVLLSAAILLIVSFILLMTINHKDTTNNPFVDLYQMKESYHEYGYWDNITKAALKLPPAKTIKIPLVDCPSRPGKLEYAYYPTNVQFNRFLTICAEDSSKMNLKGLYEIVH